MPVDFEGTLAAVPEQFAPPKNEHALIMWLNDKRRQGRRAIPERELKLNLAYLLGYQWLVWDDRNRTFAKPRQNAADPNAPIRIKANKIGAIAERFIARLTKAAPEPSCRPTSDDEKNINTAKVGTRILESEMHRLGWEDFLVRHYFWTVASGWNYAQLLWDPSKGDKMGTYAAKPGDEPRDIFTGQITLESCPAFELSVDPDAHSMRTAIWCERTKTMTRAAVWEHWGKTVTSPDQSRSIAQEVNELGQSHGHGHEAEQIAVHQFWMVPCRAAPEGMVVTWCGQTILEEPKPFPYKHGRLPFIQTDLLPGISRREGRTWLDDLIPLQADYNDARSREALIRRTLVPKIMAPAGSIDPKGVSSRVEVITYNPVAEKPTMMIPDSGWMGAYEGSMNRADEEMGQRAGQSDVSSGQAGSASMPAAAILALQEADDTKLAITYKMMTQFITEISWQLLELVRQFWTEERTVRTWSEAGAIEVKQFSGADIKGELDIQVFSETGVVRSKSAMISLTEDLFKMGVITDPRDILRLIKVPGTDFLGDNLNIDAKQAQLENSFLQTGVQISINTFDNHQVHITEHDLMRKGDEYFKLKVAAEHGDENAQKIQATIDSHVDAHHTLVMQQMGMMAPSQPEVGQGPGLGPMLPGGPMSHPGVNPMAGQYLDPATGQLPNSVQAGAGATPSALSNSEVGRRAGIGGPGQPGRVPGFSADHQAASMGH